MRKTAAVLTLIVVVVLAGSVVCFFARKSSGGHLPVGGPVPTMSVVSLDGNESVLKTIGEKKTVLFFFTADCEHCRHTIATMDCLYRSLKDTLNFIAVSLSSSEATRRLALSINLAVPVVLADEENAADLFRITGVPAVFYVDSNGILLYRRVGKRTYDAERRLLVDMLLPLPRQESHESTR